MSSENNHQLASPEDDFGLDFEKQLEHDDGAAARSHLEAGRWITYRDQKYPGAMVREWPSGKRELIEADLFGNIRVLRTL